MAEHSAPDSAGTTSKPSTTAKLTVVTLTMMVIGSMVGAGVFSLPSRLASQTGVVGALIAWIIAGTRHAHARARVSVPRRPEAEYRRRRIRVREGGFRRLPRLLLGVRLLGERLRGQRHVLDPDHVHAWQGVSCTREGRHARRGGAVLHRRMGVPPAHQARCDGRCRAQPNRHRRQDGSDTRVHPPVRVRFPPAGLHR